MNKILINKWIRYRDYLISLQDNYGQYHYIRILLANDKIRELRGTV